MPIPDDLPPAAPSTTGDGYFRFLAESVPPHVWTARPDGALDYVNRRVLDYFGVSFDRMIGDGWRDVVHPDDLPGCLETWGRSLATGERYECEFRLRRAADGAYRWFISRADALRDDRGRVAKWVGTNADVHDLKTAEFVLRENAAVIETLYDVGKTVAAELDLQRVVQVVTDAGTRLTGAQFGAFFYNVVDAAGESYTLYTIAGVPPERFSQFPMPRATALFGPTFRGEGVIRSADVTKDPRYGHSAPYHGMPAGHLPVRSYLAVPVASRSGEVVGGLFFGHEKVGVFTETAERIVSGIASQAAVAIDNARLFSRSEAAAEALRRGNEELERRVAERTAELNALNEKLQISNRELQDFASVASHDLQEPLRKIQAFGDRLLSRAGDALGDEGKDYLKRMHGAAGRMQTLINDLLAFSRVTTKAQPFEPVDLGRVAAEVVSDLETSIEKSGGRVDIGPLPTIDADPLQMRQLLQNLIGNALKFARPGVAPTVRVRAAAADDGGAVELSVADDGIGFDEKYLDRIFNVFQRLHGRGEYEGTGIGLAVCRRIAERHGGTITARSRPGEGATFVVTLPARHHSTGEPPDGV